MRSPILALSLVLVALPLTGATRLMYATNGRNVPVEWSSFPVSYEVDRRLVGAVSGGEAFIDRGFAAWALQDTNIAFRSAGVVDGARAGRDQRNTVTLSSDLYGQGYIALTTNWYDANGKITEADIQLDQQLISSNYNVQLALQHEIGHMLGLDHSAVISSVMYPYVSRGGNPVSLDSDDLVAIRGAYPKEDPALTGGTLEGRVVGNEGGIYAAQVVAVNESGQPVATALSDPTGAFILVGLPAGAYRLYAEPLDGPVDTRNLSGLWRQAKVESFPTQFCDGPPVRISNGEKIGNLVVNGSGAPNQLNPKWIGATPSDSTNFDLSATPVTLKAGQTLNLAVGGDGFTPSMTTFEVLNPGFTRVGDFRYAGNYVWAPFTIAADTTSTSAVVLVKSGRESATLTGALRVEGEKARTRVARK